MKNIIALLFLGAFCIFSCQAVPVPAAIKTAFAAKFPTANTIKWQKESATEYEANFVVEGVEMSANFAEDGTWLETEKEIPLAELPQSVKDDLAIRYKGCVIKEATFIETAKKGNIFEAEIVFNKKKMEAMYDAAGKFMGK